MAFPWLSAAILLPIAASLLIPFVPDPGDGRGVRWYALGVSLTTFLITVGAYLNGYDPSESGLQLAERALPLAHQHAQLGQMDPQAGVCRGFADLAHQQRELVVERRLQGPRGRRGIHRKVHGGAGPAELFV